MADKQIKENYLDFTFKTATGRDAPLDSFETISFQKDSTIRASGIMSKTRTMIPIGITLLRLSSP